MIEIPSAPVSHLLVFLSLFISLLLYFRIIDTFQVYFNIDQIIYNFEIWRPITSIFCFGPFGFESGFHLFKFIYYSIEIENTLYKDKPVDYIVFLLFGSIIMWIYASYMPVVYLGEPFTFYFFYYWGKRIASNMDWRSFLISPLWISLALLIIGFIKGGLYFIFPQLISYSAAHLYFFIHDVINLKYDKHFLCLSSELNSLFLDHL